MQLVIYVCCLYLHQLYCLFYTEQDLLGMTMLMFVGAIVIWRHKENLIRIKEGSEMRLSYFWNEEKEIERLMEFYKER